MGLEKTNLFLAVVKSTHWFKLERPMHSKRIRIPKRISYNFLFVRRRKEIYLIKNLLFPSGSHNSDSIIKISGILYNFTGIPTTSVSGQW